jgi:hypothetical protein
MRQPGQFFILVGCPGSHIALWVLRSLSQRLRLPRLPLIRPLFVFAKSWLAPSICKYSGLFCLCAPPSLPLGAYLL